MTSGVWLWNHSLLQKPNIARQLECWREVFTTEVAFFNSHGRDAVIPAMVSETAA